METLLSKQESKFTSNISVEINGCWLWHGCVDQKGYGRLHSFYTSNVAHRWAYERFIGPIPHNHQCHHMCGVKGCVNPSHLEALTQREHSAKHPQTRKTHCPQGHPYSGDNLYMRTDKNGHTTQHCVVCHRKRNREWMRGYKKRKLVD